jgi:glycosyltransferase involved in cell wall biosynthesis
MSITISINHFKKDTISLSLSICITVKNEFKNIEPIISEMPALASEQELILVDGHSIDGTYEEIIRLQKKYPKKNIRLILQPGTGQADAIFHGFKAAKNDCIILFEGDGTADPNDLFNFYNALVTNTYEFIEGNRFAYRESGDIPYINNLGNILFAQLFSFLLKQKMHDVLSGIKAIKKTHFNDISKNWGFLGTPDPFGDFELLFGAARLGLKIGEIPMHTKKRVYGESKTKIITHGWLLIKMIIVGFRLFRF